MGLFLDEEVGDPDFAISVGNNPTPWAHMLLFVLLKNHAKNGRESVEERVLGKGNHRCVSPVSPGHAAGYFLTQF